jgi:hypothetical protein
LDVPKYASGALPGKARRGGMVIPCNEEQRNQAYNRARSDFIHQVGMSEDSKLTIYRGFQDK